jgi:peptidoglycan/LPS O-acetylase OafA/YrhL
MLPALPQRLGRDRHLDGLRGVAALFVVIEHFSALLPIDRSPVHRGLNGELIADALFFPLQAGNFAVYIFFAISGVVVANAAIGKPLWLALPSRYFRLTVPMVAASLLAWALLSVYPAELPKIATFLPNHWTTTIYQDGAPSFRDALEDPIFGAYLHGNPKINPVLWSMQVELWGSFGIFVVYRLFSSRGRVGAMVAIALVLLAAGLWNGLAFPIGALLYELSIRDRFRWRRGLGTLIAAIGVLLGIVATLSAWRYYSGRMQVFFHPEIELKSLISSIGGLLIVGGVLASETGKTLLTTRIPLFLGRISYSLYLTHMPILYAVFAALYLALGHPPNTLRLVIWGATFCGAALIASILMTACVDEPVTRRLKVKRNGA